MPPRPPTKRSQSSEGTSAHASKKTRFVEPDDDPANFAESVDSQLEDGARRGRRFVTEGYDSDSTDDGEGVVFSRRADQAEDEDEDMFAVGAKEDSTAKSDGSSAKKKEEFLRLGDIEGQEFGGGEESEGEEDEPEDEDDAERRKKAGMGYELSSFNMREEMEEGKFSADGTYIRSFDPHAVHDKWMEEFDEKDIKKARRLHRHQERIQKEKQKAEEREMQQLGEKEDMEKALLPLLKKGETVLEALQRLGAKAKKTGAQKKRPNNKTKREAMDVDPPPDDTSSKKPATPSDIDHITHLASTLMALGDTDIYNKTYEQIVRAVRAAGKVDDAWEPPSADIKYEYKWDVPDASAEEGQVFGPYSEEEMHAWYGASFFGVVGEKVKVRRVGGDWGSWNEIVT